MTVGNMESAVLFDAGKKGRGLRANKELRAGEVVFAEPSFAAVVFDSFTSQVCHSCFRRQVNLHRCAQCKFAHYCDRTCQTACWEEHKHECAAIKKIIKAPNENVRTLATLRMMMLVNECTTSQYSIGCIAINVQEIKRGFGHPLTFAYEYDDNVNDILAARVLWRIHKDTGIVSDSQLVSVDQLEDHVADLSEEDLKQLKTDVHSFLEYWSYGRKQHSTDYISKIFSIIQCNAFTLSDQRGLQAVGVGLFPNLCLVNHDCWPNCTVILNHGKIELRALGKITEGEELTVSYVDFLNLSADRKKELKKRFHFECTCEHCSHHIKDDLMIAVAESKPSADKVKEVTAFSKECLEKIEKSRVHGNYHEVVKLCRECLGKQENVLADTHLYKLRVLSVASEVLSYLKSFTEAAESAHRMVEGYMKLYHPNNALLGMAIMRAGVTHWHAGQIEVGHGMICKAYGILMVTHGPNHSITRDLESIRMQTEMELKMFKQNEKAYQTMRDAALKSQPMASSISSDDTIKGHIRKQ